MITSDFSDLISLVLAQKISKYMSFTHNTVNSRRKLKTKAKMYSCVPSYYTKRSIFHDRYIIKQQWPVQTSDRLRKFEYS